MKKVLYFEGAGWAGAEISKETDVTNCRIRTRIRNKEGRLIYLEMTCTKYDKKSKYIPEYAKGLNYVTFIDSLFYDDAKWDKRRSYSSSLSPLTNLHFEYNKANILKFVNENLNCDFEDMEVINEGLYVFENENPLCDCSNGDYEPFKDIEINITELDEVKPIVKWEDHRTAKYRISLNSLMKLPYMKSYIEEQTKNNNAKFSKDGNYSAVFRWDKDGIITDLELHCGCCMGVGAENVQTIINYIKEDAKNETINI